MDNPPHELPLSISPRELLRDLFRQSKAMKVDAGQTVFRTGDPCDGLYLVIEGLFKVTAVLPSKRERVLAILGSDALIGEVSAVDRGARSACVIALRPSRLSFISLAQLDDFGRLNPDIYREIAILLARRLRGSNESLAVNTLSIKGRAARAVLKLADLFGKNLGTGRVLIQQKLSQDELAAMAGIARENLSRTLQDWTRQRWLSRPAKYYCIENKAALQREAQV